MRRTMRLTRCTGHSGVIEMIAQQLGLAMMPWCVPSACALISGTTSGTAASMRNAEELSITVAPARTASGAKRRELAHAECAAAKLERLARRARRGEQPQLGEREGPLFQATNQLDAHGTGGTDDRDHRRGTCNSL